MPQQGGFLDAQCLEQLLGVRCQLLEAVLIVRRLAGGAEADLVRGDDPIAGVAEGFDRAVPSGTAKVLAMHQHHAATVGLAVGGDVHIAHLQGLALGFKGEMLECVGIVEPLQLRAVFRRLGVGFGVGDGGQGGSQQQAG
ncbi:hypothetical protein D3C78_918910 [compost metagenome]